WVSWICLFDFELNHVSANKHKLEDALSQQICTEGNEEESLQDIEDFIEVFLNKLAV
ncbi:hypothetical protein L218DRAFT_796529, partial [Marasmius fiardii PR-910]